MVFMDRYICIHGHFYQPPRENPWLEEIEIQDSAHPFHDWNERITSECYGPNAVARILNHNWKIEQLINNYSRISFNFGPSLLEWLDKKYPAIYARILEGDRLSQERYGGHGSAIAQVYHHGIMPLANRRDKETQILWGIQDFEARFQRKPEGMWLAETAVDLETLDLLAEYGIRFTILSPYQAARVRPLDADAEGWHDVQDGSIDPTMPYRQTLPSGREIDLFFYHDRLSQAVAFDRLLNTGEGFSQALLEGFRDRPGAQLVHIATDGESYGHHRHHGDMALAFALHSIETQQVARLTNYGEFLGLFPPRYAVEILENTSWSYHHGVDRWWRESGCNTGQHGWSQAWREPLREALDWLRDTVAEPFEALGREVLRDPWAARNDFIHYRLQPTPEVLEEYIHEHAALEPSRSDRSTILKLMELQRNALLMFNSCGWFVDEVSGIETVQLLMYAGRVIQLAEELFERELEPGFLQILEKAPSNLPEHVNGRKIYEKWVKPARIGWHKIAAHYAISSLFEEYPETTQLFRYAIERHEQRSFQAGRVRFLIGHARLESLITREAWPFQYAVLHMGDHHVNCGVGPYQDAASFEAVVADCAAACERVDYPHLIRLMDHHLGESSYSLASLFRDEQRRVLKRVLRESLSETEAIYARIHEQQLPLMRFLEHLEVPLPRAFRTATEFLYTTDLRWALQDEDPDFEHIKQLLLEAQQWEVPIDAAQMGYRFSRLLGRVGERWQEAPEQMELLETLRQGVELARSVALEINLWRVQNSYFQVRAAHWSRLLRRAARGRPVALAWMEEFVELGELLDVEVSGMRETVAQIQQAPSVIDLVQGLIQQRIVPSATYRLQLHQNFPFDKAQEILPYLRQLGISTCYLSPILKARKGSMHGYDICDHTVINPELGGEEAFLHFSDTAQSLGLTVLLDTVPNHMGIGDVSNRWWMDVLENGIHSRYASYFDIDWRPVNPDLNDKILLPILGDQFGLELEGGKLRLNYIQGAFQLHYYDHTLPVATVSQRMILERTLELLQKSLPADHEDVLELESIITALEYLLPGMSRRRERVDELYREKEIIRRRIRDLEAESEAMRDALERTVGLFNGRVADPTTFDHLDQLVEAQSYRPAFWKVAMEEINYRRFFDVNDLAAIRVERPEVFEATHRMFLRYLGEGRAMGLRIDHPDGLRDPTDYFRRLQQHAIHAILAHQLPSERDREALLEEVGQALQQLQQTQDLEAAPWAVYVVAEKILAEDETLPAQWTTAGTTGYDFMNLVNSLFVDMEHREAFDILYREYLGVPIQYKDLLNSCKKRIMLVSMASEINSLSHQLDRLAERNRQYRDFTLNSLTFAIREVIAALPVYRTYIVDPEAVTLRDRLLIENTIRESKGRNPRTAESVFDFIGDTLLLRNLERFQEAERPKLIDWVMRFQQMTGPIMAKGVEDTAFYIYNRLISLNEVGGEPPLFGCSLETYHEHTLNRYRHFPHSMLASSTHDTKRSEDVRARINVLSELPAEWRSALFVYSQLNAQHLTQVDELAAPSPNDQYLLYQTLIGAWPPGPLNAAAFAEFRQRIIQYMLKATKEAKDRTSWINPVAEYDQAVERFITAILPDDPNDPFLVELRPLQKKVAYFGYFNSLAQLVLKYTSPGLPDLYQGNELWDFSLVDPDNRRPVDYPLRQQLLDQLQQRLGDLGEDLRPLHQEYLDAMEDGRSKLFVTYQLLQLRWQHPELFARGDYQPLYANEAYQTHICAFARQYGSHRLVVVVPRLLVRLLGGEQRTPLGQPCWGAGQLSLPQGWSGTFCPLFGGPSMPAENGVLPLADLFASFPVAVLTQLGPEGL